MKKLSAAIRKTRRSLNGTGLFKQKRSEERRARKEIKIMTPLSPFGRKANNTSRVPVPAPRRSEK